MCFWATRQAWFAWHKRCDYPWLLEKALAYMMSLTWMIPINIGYLLGLYNIVHSLNLTLLLVWTNSINFYPLPLRHIRWLWRGFLGTWKVLFPMTCVLLSPITYVWKHTMILIGPLPLIIYVPLVHIVCSLGIVSLRGIHQNKKMLPIQVLSLNIMLWFLQP